MSYNYLIAINKPINWTSSDVVIKVRNILSKALGEKVKVGHMGTLDPIATGVLLLGINKATRLFDYLLSRDKEYIGTLTFGTSTDTLDSMGKVEETSSLPTLCDIKAKLPQFIGNISQIPPKYSAIKINGQKAYNLARAGKAVEIEPRKVNIFDIQIVDFKGSEDKVESITLDVKCSSGTYIRSLFFDIASSINVAGHMSMLNRVALSNINIQDCVTIEELENNPTSHFIQPMVVLNNIMKSYALNDEEYLDVSNGVGTKIDSNDEYLALLKDGEVKFVAQNINGIYKSVTNLQ